MTTRTARALGALILSSAIAAGVAAQEREDRTLLPTDQLRAIVNEASGERAMHHLLELVPYPRVRPAAEYEGHFRESEVMARFAREYGFSSVEIESFPVPQPMWNPITAQLWLTGPGGRKLYDVYDVAVSIAANSADGDVTADVVDVGVGSKPEDYAGKDVAGKVVLGSAGAAQLQRLAVFERGAVGVLSSQSIRPEAQPDAIMTQTIAATAPQGKQPGFAWSIATRVARELQAKLARGEKVTVRSVVKGQTFPGELEVVHATIAGDGSTTQEVAISAHLYEGYLKQGANDDNSGCAMTLEVGRAYIQLVKEGKLPKPKRTIHFVWASEISGTTAWLAKHQDVKQRLIADLNFDMEGLGLRLGGAYWILHRTPDTFPSYLNDVSQSVLEWAAEVNRERVRYRANGYGPSLPIVAPNGSSDPFYIKVDKHYGSSDHVVYLNSGIASVIFNTWPDPWYHTSQDTPDKMDPTMFKRAAVVSTAAMSLLASAGDRGAAGVAGESVAYGTARMAEAERKAMAYLAEANDAQALAAAFKEAKNAVRHQAAIEQAVVKSVAVLFDNPTVGERWLNPFVNAVDKRAAALQDELRVFYLLQTGRLNVPPVEPPVTDLEKEAARLVPARGIPTGGGPGGGGGGGGNPFAALQNLPAEARAAVEAAQRKIPQHMLSELNILVGQKKTVLEIRDFLSGEFEPLPLADLMAYFRAQESAKLVTLTTRP